MDKISVKKKKKKNFPSNGALNRVCYALRRISVHYIRASRHETWSGQEVSVHCWSEKEPHAPFLSSGDVRSGSKPCCIFNESLTSSVSLFILLELSSSSPAWHSWEDRKQAMSLSLTEALKGLITPLHPPQNQILFYRSTNSR